MLKLLTFPNLVMLIMENLRVGGEVGREVSQTSQASQELEGTIKILYCHHHHHSLTSLSVRHFDFDFD